MTETRWCPQEVSEELTAAIRRGGHGASLARLLALRGVKDHFEAARFLSPSLDHAHCHSLLPDMETAAKRLATAVRDGELILVYGDYDVDGVCAAAILGRVLQVLKANFQVKVPHRKRDGYDLRIESVQAAHAAGVKLIVTADCGIVAFSAAEEARRLGVDLVITDHHAPDASGRLPDALAVVNPRRPDSQYPFPEICGTAVAFKLCSALVEEMGISSRAFATRFLDLVALATCADAMPLRDENRAFVSLGLAEIKTTRKKGLAELLRLSEGRSREVTARSLTHGLGPRINAAGRMDDPATALTLLLTDDEEVARTLAAELDRINLERRQEQDRMIVEAVRLAQNQAGDRILVLHSDRWHPGLIGIVAGRLAETFCRPTVLVAVGEDGNGRGSCRSVENYDIHGALGACRELFQRFGGHPAAAGFDIDAAQLPGLAARLAEIAAETLSDEHLSPSLRIDLELPPAEITTEFARELQRFEPFGHGNPAPVFLTRGLRVIHRHRLPNRSSSAVDHLKLVLEHPSRPGSVEALLWNGWDRADICEPESRIDACYELQINEYNGVTRPQLRLRDFRAAGG